MTIQFIAPPRKREHAVLKAVILSGSLALLAACSSNSGRPFDWDLRSGDTSTAGDARQATASRPQADYNGVISYPGYQMAQARRGETVAAMAYRLRLNPTDLARANALQPGDTLREGELVLLNSRVAATPQPVIAANNTPIYPANATTSPYNTNSATAIFDRVDSQPLDPIVQTAPLQAAPVQSQSTASGQASSIRPVLPSSQASASTPGGGQQPMRHVVTRGESASIIARRYNVTLQSLADWNNLGPQMGVREGQTLIIPVATGTPPKREATPSAPGAGSPTPPPPSASKPLPQERPQATVKDTPKSPDLGSQRTAASATKLAMPLSGNIVKAYDKRSNQGIDIAGSPGAAIRAAEAGSVAAITKDTEQVQIVVIRHANGLLTVYAGVDQLKIKKGDTVTRGQQIGSLRGGANSALHFEVRKGVDSIDPMSYLQ